MTSAIEMMDVMALLVAVFSFVLLLSDICHIRAKKWKCQDFLL